jgi:hypothetical protein
MKIGLLVHFFDFRNDVRRFIEVLSLQGHEIVLFCREEDYDKILEHNSNHEIRVIKDRVENLSNKILERLYLIFKVLPKSKNNYFLMEYFKASGAFGKKLNKALNIIKLQKIFNGFISYDWYIANLKFNEITKIDDLEAILVFTEITDDYFFARIIKQNVPHLIYVYSWDHPCKHTRFSKKSKYLVWNSGIKGDLIKLQGIPENKISIFGSTQFGFIYDYFNQPKSKRFYNFKYIYFGCSVGLADVAKEEISKIIEIANLLLITKPDWKFVIRPYPHLMKWGVYDELKQLDNVIFDDQYKKLDFSIDFEEIFLKFKKIEEAEYFVHSGSTIGLEACFFDTPSLILTPPLAANKSIKNLHNFAFQFQNEKYLIAKYPINCISNSSDFVKIIKNENFSQLLEKSKVIRSQFDIKSFLELEKNLISILNNG